MKKGSFKYQGQELQWDSEGKVRVVDYREIDESLEEYVDMFKTYVKKLDDEIFLNAVEMFPEVSGVSTHVLSDALEECIESGKICTYITYFKNCVEKAKAELKK